THGIVFQIHANEHTAEVQACLEAHAKRPIEYLHSLGALGRHTLIAHAALVTPEEIRLLEQSGAAVAYNPVARMWKGNGVARAAGIGADSLLVDRRSPEVLPSWAFTWELVRYFDRADILAVVVDGRPVLLDGRAACFDSAQFVADSLAEGERWIQDTGIVRLH